MPLYNNILLSRKGSEQNKAATDQPADAGPSASMKLLQDHLMSKRRAKQQTQAQRTQKSTDKSQIVLESTLHKPSENSWDPHDEYDPIMPNSYEVLQAEYIKAEEQQRQASRAKGGLKFDPNILHVLDRLEEDDPPRDNKTIKGTSIAPPPSLTTSSTSTTTSTQDCQRPPPVGPSLPRTIQSTEKLDGASAAAKIMSKMGYKAGQGLGRDEQGMSEPLGVEKCSLNVGRIISKSAPRNESNEATRLLLLQNMVGPGEVDNDLEAETKEECKKYGEVVKCLIYEIPNKRVPDDEAVRIFVEFQAVESAARAVSDLNGRYFGGRVVKATFYNLDKFNRYELGS